MRGIFIAFTTVILTPIRSSLGCERRGLVCYYTEKRPPGPPPTKPKRKSKASRQQPRPPVNEQEQPTSETDLEPVSHSSSENDLFGFAFTEHMVPLQGNVHLLSADPFYLPPGPGMVTPLPPSVPQLDSSIFAIPSGPLIESPWDSLRLNFPAVSNLINKYETLLVSPDPMTEIADLYNNVILYSAFRPHDYTERTILFRGLDTWKHTFDSMGGVVCNAKGEAALAVYHGAMVAMLSVPGYWSVHRTNMESSSEGQEETELPRDVLAQVSTSRDGPGLDRVPALTKSLKYCQATEHARQAAELLLPFFQGSAHVLDLEQRDVSAFASLEPRYAVGKELTTHKCSS